MHRAPSFPGNSSLLYELERGKCGVQLAPHIGAFNASGFHSPFVNPVDTVQNQHARKSSQSTEVGKPPRNEKDEGEENIGGESEKPRHVLVCVCIKIDQRVACLGVSSVLASGRSPFFLSLPHPEPLHRRYLNMNTASVLAGAHDFVANNSTFNTANTVSRMVIMSTYQ